MSFHTGRAFCFPALLSVPLLLTGGKKGTMSETDTNDQAGAYFDPLLAPIRSNLNPLRQLTMPRATSLLEMSLRGYYADITWLYAHVERREHVMASLFERRQSTLGQCIWSIDLTEHAAKEESIQDAAKQQQEVLQEAFAQIDNLKEAWKWLGVAKFRGFAHLEKHYDAKGQVKHLEPVPQWFWCRNWPNMRWQFNASALNSNIGEQIESEHFVIREVPACLGELAVYDYIRKSLCIRDWGTFASTFGIPNIFLECTDPSKYPNDAEKTAWLNQLRNYVANGRGVLPAGMKANMLSGGSSDGTPFPKLVEYIDSMLVLAGTGGKLTMLSDSTGIGQGATPAHERVWEEIAAEEGAEIAEILHRSIAEPILREQFPGEPIHVRFTIRRRDQVDQQAGADLLGKLKQAGWRVNEEEAERITGMNLEQVEEATGDTTEVVQQDEAKASNRITRNEQDETTEASADILKGIEPIMNRLARILAIEDEQERNKELEKFNESLPDELSRVNAQSGGTETVEKMLVESVVSGLTVEKGT